MEISRIVCCGYGVKFVKNMPNSVGTNLYVQLYKIVKKVFIINYSLHIKLGLTRIAQGFNLSRTSLLVRCIVTET